MTNKDKSDDPKKSNVTPLLIKRSSEAQDQDEQDQNAANGGAAASGMGHNKVPFHIRLAERYLELMAQCDSGLHAVPDGDGQSHFWKYENGSWTLLLDKEVVKWLTPKLQTVLTDDLDQNRKSTNKLFSEATQYIIRHP